MPKPMVHSPLPEGGVHSQSRPRGAKRGPIHKIFAAPWHETTTVPAEVVVIPPNMSMQGNDQYGDCVTAEEAAAKEAYSVFCGLSELVVPDSTTISWAQAHGDLNGAELTPVMDDMAKDGMTISGTNYKDGPWKVVDFTSEPNLQSALAIGPVKIGIDANALSPGAGNGNGWYSVGGHPGQFQNEDHCVSIFGFCTAARFYSAIGKPVPSALDPNKVGYILYTWGGVGYVDHDWIMSTCDEAYVRNPTTVGQNPPTPTPVPPVPPSPPTPPSPPAPPPVQQLVATQASIPFNLKAFGFVPISGTIGPVNAPVSVVPSHLGSITGFMSIFQDVLAIMSAISDDAALKAAVSKLLVDLGLQPLPFSATYAPLGSVSIWAIFGDALAIYAAIQTQNPAAIEAAVTKLLTDLGIVKG